MNVAVCIKHAVDEGELMADPTGKPQLKGALSKMSTFDRNAVEEAVRIKESKGGSVTVLSLGNQDWKKSLKEALAMGCDRAIAVLSSGDLDTLSTSYYLSRALRRAGGFDLILFSEGASDTYDGVVGPMVAEWLQLPFLGYARRVEVGENSVKVESALDDRSEGAEAAIPAVLSVVSEVNSPRFPTLLQIMQASKKPMDDVTTEALRDDQAPREMTRVASVTIQSVDRKRVLLEGSPEQVSKNLLESLRKEGVL